MSGIWVTDISSNGVSLSAFLQCTIYSIAVASGLTWESPDAELSIIHISCDQDVVFLISGNFLGM